MTDDKEWGRRLAVYKTSSNSRAVLEMFYTLAPLAVLWGVMWWSLSISYWLTLAICLVASGLMVRVFIIQHDCGHGALFSSKKVNDWVGRVMGVLTFTPYDDWRREHALHHAGSGNLDRRGFGEISTLTVEEYKALSKKKQLGYWLYRNPITLFLIGPAYQFLFRQRWHTGNTKNKMPIYSTHLTNIGMLAFALVMISMMGWKAYFLIQIPLIVMTATIGVWLFYVQHQFDETYWEYEKEWKREEAALHGSSYYDLPQPLQWFSGNIGIHHVHHISSKIPFHVLPKVIKKYPELTGIGHLTLWESFKCVQLTLWDEKSKTLISFKKYRAEHAVAA